jgi:hypothetical protein
VCDKSRMNGKMIVMKNGIDEWRIVCIK